MRVETCWKLLLQLVGDSLLENFWLAPKGVLDTFWDKPNSIGDLVGNAHSVYFGKCSIQSGDLLGHISCCVPG
jgi:hypothetical protein